MEENNSKRGQLKAIVLLLIGFIIGFATHAFTVSEEAVMPDDQNNTSEELVDTEPKLDEDDDKQEVSPADKSDKTTSDDMTANSKEDKKESSKDPKVPFDATPNNSSNSGYSFSVVDQSAGGVAYISSLTFPKESWIAIRENRNGELGNILGASWYPAGTQTGVVKLLRNTKAGQTYYAVIYLDNDGDKDFNHEIDTLFVDNEGNTPAAIFRTY